MPCRTRTRELYDALVDGFREQPGNASHAARKAGCDRRMAKRAWEVGWPELVKSHPYARPINEVIEDEKAAVRAQLYEAEAESAMRAAQAREEQRRARQDALDQKAREARAVRAALNSGMGLLGLAGEVSKAMFPVVQRAAETLVDPSTKTTPSEVINLLRRLAWIGQASTNIIGRAMELDRLRLGQPERILGVTTTADEEFDADRAVDLLGSEDEVKGAIIDLVEGRMSERAAKLIEASVPRSEKEAAS